MTDKKTVKIEAPPEADVAPEAAQVDDVAARCAALEKERDELKDKLLRAQAECANISKRLHQQHFESLKLAGIDLVRSILPVVDTLNHTLEMLSQHQVEQSVIDGVKLIADDMNKALREHGVLPIEALGRPFDPSRHEALTQDRDSDQPVGTVTNEFQRGYQMHGRVLRPARVAVAAAAEDAATEPRP